MQPDDPTTTTGNTDENTDDFDESTVNEGESQVPQLPEDNQTPFSPPTSPVDDAAEDLDRRINSNRLDDTHQRTDDASDMDAQEVYDAGEAAAAGGGEPNAGNSVVGYDKPEDQHDQPDGDKAA
jgi:hypothetical protein